MRRLLAALFALLLPLSVSASPAQEIAERFIDVLVHDDMARLANFIDPAGDDPRAWEELRSLLDYHDCIHVGRYDWSLESASDDRVAVRVDVELTGLLKAAWRPERRLPRSWHLEARRIDGAWRLMRVFTEERRIGTAMAGAPSAADAECIAGEARDADPLLVIARYSRELSEAKDVDLARLDHALALARNTGDVQTEIKVLIDYAVACPDRARGLQLALDAEKRALGSGTPDDIAEMRLMLGLMYVMNGERERGRQTYAAGAEMIDALDDPTTAVMCLEMYIWAAQGLRPIDDLRGAEKLLELARRIGWEEGEQDALFNHQDAHSELGNIDVARADNLLIIRLAETQGNRKFAAYAEANVATLELSQRHYAEAIVRFRRALGRFISDPTVREGMWNSLAGAHIHLHQYAEAAQALEEAEEGLLPDDPAHIELFARRSELQRVLGRTAESVASAREALRRFDALVDERRDLSLRGMVLYNLALGLKASGNGDEAIEQLRQAIASIEMRQEEIGADALGRVTFLQQYAEMYVELVKSLIARDQIEEAFRVAEQMKSRGLREAIAESHIDLSASLSADERAREEALQKRIAELNRTLLAARQKGTPARATEEQLAAARRELHAFRAEIRLEHPATGRRRIDELGAVELPPGSKSLALIEYVVADDEVLAFVVRGASPVRVVRLRLPLDRLQHDVRELESLIAARSPAYRGAARRLHAALFAPLEPYLPGRTAVAIVPDGVLWTVPFHALIGADGRHLLDRYTIFYAHSLSLLRNASTLRSAAPSRLLALGNPTIVGGARSTVRAVFRDAALGPLDDAEKEVRSLAAMYPPKERSVYYGDAASERLFKREAPGFRVIHLAAHAIVDDRAPMYSAIVLASGGKGSEDGLLEAREVVDLSLNADLAVLSACQTARGQVGSGEGVIGLSWAFFAAGCPTTVVSQWSAESAATARLMVEFHRRLRAGESTAKALRDAQLSVRAVPKYRHPFYWAPFVAIGAAQR